MTAVRQEPWKAVVHLLLRLIEPGSGARCPPSRCDPLQRPVALGGKKNNVAVPRPPSQVRRGGQRHSGAAVGVDSLQLAIRTKSDESAVGRPERIACVFGSGQRLGGERTE